LKNQETSIWNVENYIEKLKKRRNKLTMEVHRWNLKKAFRSTRWLNLWCSLIINKNICLLVLFFGDKSIFNLIASIYNISWIVSCWKISCQGSHISTTSFIFGEIGIFIFRSRRFEVKMRFLEIYVLIALLKVFAILHKISRSFRLILRFVVSISKMLRS
jgi:hypothetical protein